MNPLDLLSGLKAYLVGGALLALVAAAGVQTVRLSSNEATLAQERQARAQEDADRSSVELHDALRTSEKMATFAATQQGLTDDLTNETAARVAAERSNGQLSAGLRDAFAAVATARRRAEAQTSCPVSGAGGDRPDPLDGLFEEAGGLLARSADLQEEAGSIVRRRDSEVKALKTENDALRVLEAE